MHQKYLYVSPKYKAALALAIAFFYFAKCFEYSQNWISDIDVVLPNTLAVMIVLFIALVPGFINMFISLGLIFDKKKVTNHIGKELPPISILIAAYNEEDSIYDTLTSIVKQDYPNKVECIVINDGSVDNTCKRINDFIAEHQQSNITIKLVDLKKNGGKSNALNAGLMHSTHDNILTVDGDCWLYTDALAILVTDFISSTDVAMAGTVLTKNSRTNWITKLQEQDYQFSIASIKRAQHLCRGVLVAQGALSIYKKWIIKECGGWQHCVGEDIVLSWDMLNRGYTIGHSDRAICFTNVPESYKQYFQQRRRWARGMVESFRRFPSILFDARLHTIFIWFNLLFPFLDFFYLFVFIPAILLALVFKYYLLVSTITLLLLPIGAVMNTIMLNKQIKVFKFHGLKIRKHYIWMIIYLLFGNLLSSPASLAGYMDEFMNKTKKWGTK